MTLGRAIKQARAGLGIRQKTLATVAGIQQKYLSRIENDHADPGWGVLQRLLVVLDLDLQALARERQEPTP
jgi:transcriptional regulator with XRE-family HTH domain